MLIEIYADGASRGQGKPGVLLGEAACAVVILKNGKLIGQIARGLGKRSNNEAEYEAVLLAILMAWAADLADPIIYSDSTVVVNQVSGKWKCKSSELLSLLLTIQDINQVFRFRIQHAPRKTPGIQGADSLANAFLDTLETRIAEGGN